MELARLLSPEDFGLTGMVTPLTSFLGLFRDAGLFTATVQPRDLTHEQISTLFWINVAVGVSLARTRITRIGLAQGRRAKATSSEVRCGGSAYNSYSSSLIAPTMERSTYHHLGASSSGPRTAAGVGKDHGWINGRFLRPFAGGRSALERPLASDGLL
jgi:hypothetical protein